MSAQVVVVTLANAARLQHVTRQASLIPDGVGHIVVALDDADALRKALPYSAVCDSGRANLAEARNRGGDAACERGADVIVFLDADCVPGEHLIPRYVDAVNREPNAVLSGPVTYLPEGEFRTQAPQPHAARPDPADGQLQRAEHYE